MSALDKTGIVAVIGAGAMGAGIAQVAAQAGHAVVLFDVKPGAAQKSIAGIASVLGKQVEKGKLDARARDAIVSRLKPAEALDEIAPAALVIEAVIEDLAVKRKLFQDVEALTGADAILASNTSSMSVTALGNGLKRPQRLAGLHFFNPAPLMALVEVVSGLATDPAVAATLFDTAEQWGKVPVHAKSTPGFIVNRVARPFYGEALRVAQERGADIATLDAILREAGGFRMGAFELMDLIGHDVNFAVTQSVWRALYHDSRFLPSLLQQELVEAGWLGRKTGRGFYDHGPGAEPPRPAQASQAKAPAHVVAGTGGVFEAALAARARAAGWALEARNDSILWRAGAATLALTDGRSASERAHAEGLSDLVLLDLVFDPASARRIAVAPAEQAGAEALADATGLLQALGFAVSVMADIPGLLVARTVAMLANEAAEVVHYGVASAADTDMAMMKGVNYPRGPLAWAQDIGLVRILTILDNLAGTYGEDRYRASALLRRKVAAGTTFLD